MNTTLWLCAAYMPMRTSEPCNPITLMNEASTNLALTKPVQIGNNCHLFPYNSTHVSIPSHSRTFTPLLYCTNDGMDRSALSILHAFAQ